MSQKQKRGQVYGRSPCAGKFEVVVVMDGQTTVYELEFEQTRALAIIATKGALTWPVKNISYGTIDDDDRLSA